MISGPRVITIRLHKEIDCFYGFCQEMACAAGIVDHFWIDCAPFGFYHPINWQTVPNEPGDRNRSEKLSFVLLETLVQKLLEQITQELMLRRVNDSVFLKQLHHLHEDFSVLIEQLFVVDIFEGKIIVRIEFQNTNCVLKILNCFFTL